MSFSPGANQGAARKLSHRPLRRAAVLLRTTAEPVTEIAFRVGFNDSNYFTRQFVKLFGCSPDVTGSAASPPG